MRITPPSSPSSSPAYSNRLSHLMELYEHNYAAIRLLIPELQQLAGNRYLSQVDGCLPLHLRIEERGPYTTTINLSYRFMGPGAKTESAPDISLRIYHDARLAEAMSGLIHGQRHVQRRVRDLEEGWRLNRFLHKWLGYCRRRGHRFDRRTAYDTVIGKNQLQSA